MPVDFHAANYCCWYKNVILTFVYTKDYIKTMCGKLSGFDWDDGNIQKCQKHKVSIEEIEALFS